MGEIAKLWIQTAQMDDEMMFRFMEQFYLNDLAPPMWWLKLQAERYGW